MLHYRNTLLLSNLTVWELATQVHLLRALRFCKYFLFLCGDLQQTGNIIVSSRSFNSMLIQQQDGFTSDLSFYRDRSI